MATLLRNPQSAVFPAAEVEARIRDALADQAADQALLRPGRGAQSGARPWEPDIDSLVVIEIICAVEELLGVSLPPTFAPKGGYDSADECINDLTSEARSAWAEITREKQTND